MISAINIFLYVCFLYSEHYMKECPVDPCLGVSSVVFRRVTELFVVEKVIKPGTDSVCQFFKRHPCIEAGFRDICLIICISG